MLGICQESEPCWMFVKKVKCWMFVKQVNHVRYLSRRYTMLDVCQEGIPCLMFVKKVDHVGVCEESGPCWSL